VKEKEKLVTSLGEVSFNFGGEEILNRKRVAAC
jgi:hypothetical protein